jgi:alkanesulfonate monooxygenase SsuD/methylene tetrahydromethanopterin reductase-like flavin-dependent oxidoreductase (luciferase family)
MRIGAVLSPTGDWPAILEAAQLADRHGLDAIGFWDHYHSERPDWTYVCGWSAYGALAQATARIRLVPMVIARYLARGSGNIHGRAGATHGGSLHTRPT